ncbi:MAG: tRNA (adenosine(37)-N6)-threonylcarbamoyltransferase complex ATPase subunit type 1 TsaE [Balneolaceae bacterium]
MNPQDSYESHSEEETLRLAEKIGKQSVAGDVICLSGELGAGKTRFVKGFVRAFGLDPTQVTSPTFTIIQEYSGTLPVYHFDCYRIENVEEVLEIGAEEYFYGDGVSIIEWPEKISAVLPEHAIRIEIEVTGRNSRTIKIKQNKKKLEV